MSSKSNGKGKGDGEKRQKSISSFVRTKRRKTKLEIIIDQNSDDPYEFDDAVDGVSTERRSLRERKDKTQSSSNTDDVIQTEQDEMERVIQMSKQQAVEDEKRRKRKKLAEREHIQNLEKGFGLKTQEGSSTVTRPITMVETDDDTRNYQNQSSQGKDEVSVDHRCESPSLFPSQEYNSRDEFENESPNSSQYNLDQDSGSEKHDKSCEKSKPAENLTRRPLSLRKKKLPQEDPDFLKQLQPDAGEEKKQQKRKSNENDSLKYYKIPKLNASARVLRPRKDVSYDETSSYDENTYNKRKQTVNSVNRESQMTTNNQDKVPFGEDWDFNSQYEILGYQLYRFKNKRLKRTWTLEEAKRAELYFAPPGVNPVKYTGVIEAMLEEYRINLYLAQSKLLEFIPWSQGVVCGRTIEGTLDARKYNKENIIVRPQLRETLSGSNVETDVQSNSKDNDSPETTQTRRTLRSSNFYGTSTKKIPNGQSNVNNKQDDCYKSLDIEDDDNDEVLLIDENASVKKDQGKVTGKAFIGKLKDVGSQIYSYFVSSNAKKTTATSGHTLEHMEEMVNNAGNVTENTCLSETPETSTAEEEPLVAKKRKHLIFESSDEEGDESKFNLEIPAMSSPQASQEQLSPTIVSHNFTKSNSQETNSLPSTSSRDFMPTEVSSSNGLPKDDSVAAHSAGTSPSGLWKRTSARKIFDNKGLSRRTYLNETSQPSSVPVKNGNHRRDEVVDLTEDYEESSGTLADPNISNNSKTSEENFLQCPMCFKNFDPNIIAEHAAQCDGPPVSSSLRSGKMSNRKQLDSSMEQDILQSKVNSYRQTDKNTHTKAQSEERREQSIEMIREEKRRNAKEYSEEEMNALRAQSAAFATVPTSPFKQAENKEAQEQKYEKIYDAVNSSKWLDSNSKSFFDESTKAQRNILQGTSKKAGVKLPKVAKKLDFVKVGNTQFNVSKLEKGSFTSSCKSSSNVQEQSRESVPNVPDKNGHLLDEKDFHHKAIGTGNFYKNPENTSNDKEKDTTSTSNKSWKFKTFGKKPEHNLGLSIKRGSTKKVVQMEKSGKEDMASNTVEEKPSADVGKPRRKTSVLPPQDEFIPQNLTSMNNSDTAKHDQNKFTSPPADTLAMSSEDDSDESELPDISLGTRYKPRDNSGFGLKYKTETAMDLLNINYKGRHGTVKSGQSTSLRKGILDNEDSELLRQSYADKRPMASSWKKSSSQGVNNVQYEGYHNDRIPENKRKRKQSVAENGGVGNGEEEKCFICNKLFPKNEIQQHVNEELDRQTREMEEENHKESQGSIPSTSHKRQRKHSPASNRNGSGLFAALENLSQHSSHKPDRLHERQKKHLYTEDQQQTDSDIQFEVDSDELTDSPVKTFRSIDSLNGGFIDYKNQFRKKGRSSTNRSANDEWEFIEGKTNTSGRGRGRGGGGRRGGGKQGKWRKGRGRKNYYKKRS